MSFNLLDHRIRSFLEEKGWEEATGPQEEAIPVILSGKHTLLIAPTGMGKTEAAVFPLFHRLMLEKTPGISLLYITPLRALNRDMLRRMEEIGEHLGIKVAVRHGDTSQAERNRQSRNPPDVLITTPETFQILFTGSKLRKAIENVRFVVLDEVHELASSDRGAQMAVALERLERLTAFGGGKPLQRIGLSATVGDPYIVANFLGGKGREVSIVKVPVVRNMILRVEAPEKIEGEKDVADLLRAERDVARAILFANSMIKEHVSTLLFVNTRDTAEALGARFLTLGPKDVLVHHGSLSKDIRVQAEELFKKGEARALICTSSLELGIDIGTADHVIQYNSPRSPSRLVQRVGRSGHHVGGQPKGTIIVDRPDEAAEACVISRMALSEELELWKVRPCPLEVLANQAMAFFLFEGRNVPVSEFISLVQAADPFRDMSLEEASDVLDFLSSTGTLFIDGGRGRCGSRGRSVFYENISMIPDEKSYIVRDITTRQIIGKLDERFAASFVTPTASLVVGGRTWEVVTGDEGEILVEPVADMGEIPHWSGEDLPVPFEVARRVGMLRDSGVLPDDMLHWSANDRSRTMFGEYVQKQKVEGSSVAGESLVVVEGGRGDVVINACLGTRINETIGKLVSGLLAARLGQSVAVQIDAYRIILQGPVNMNCVLVADIMKDIKPDTIEGLLDIMLKNSSYTKWHFVHAARKFGIVRKDLDYTSINMDRIMEEYVGTPVYRAAFGKVVWEKMDIDGTAAFFQRIVDGKVVVEVSPKISKIGSAGYEKMKEVVMTRTPTHAILMALKERILSEKALLVCMSCHKGRTTRVGDIEEKVRCIYCNGGMVAAVHPRQREETMALLEKKNMGRKERKILEVLRKNATLVMSHGKTAVMALRARGIGPAAASKILGFHRDEDEFLASILKSEVEYARNRRFWD